MKLHYVFLIAVICMLVGIHPFGTRGGITFAQTCLPPPSGIVSWWPLDNYSNDIADGNNPSATNWISYVPGKVGPGVTFTVPPNSSTAGGYIDIPHSVNLALQRFAIDAWVKPNGIGPNNDNYGSTIISKPVTGINAVELLWRGDGRFCFLFGDINNNRIFSSGTFPPGSFYHVAATYDGTDFKLFVNGTLQGTRSLPNYTITYNASHTWTIGSEPAPWRNIGWPRTWNGIIDEVHIFNRALSAGEIQAIFNANSAGMCNASCPDVTTHPSDQTVCEGSEVSFSADASGSPTPTLEWQVSTDGGSAWNPTGSGTSPLTFMASASQNGNQYRAVFTNSCGSATTSAATLTVNAAPTITCPSNISMNNAPNQCGAVVDFAATATGIPTPSITYSQNPGTFFPVGTTTITATATNSCGSSSCSFTVTVTDNENPTISVSLSPNTLWPPNHSLRDITATVTVSDNCPGVSYVLTSITSNEPDDGLGDGDTMNDIQDASYGNLDTSFKLRAERSATGKGRMYHVTYTATDAAGNSASATASVRVPPDQRGFRFGDDYIPPEASSTGFVPDHYVLHQNRPNPFNPTTKIRFEIPIDAGVVLTVYDVLGREVARLVNERRQAGVYEVNFDGGSLMSGIYFYRISGQSEGKLFTDVKKMLLLK